MAGTNGKGSVVAFLRSILEAHDRRAHVFTSPHLVRFHERIVIAGEEIDDQGLCAILEECEDVNAGRPITFFEITAAAALLAFARVPADVTLLETGLGGRLDATNVVPRPALTALTAISLDHQSFLGDTIGAIAAEKAGILKPGAPCVSVAQHPEAEAAIRRHAEAIGAPVVWQGRDWFVRPSADGFRFEGGGRSLTLPCPALSGAFQIVNAGQAVCCAGLFPGLDVDERALRHGIRSARWPGRLQRLDRGRLRRLLPGEWELWVDGGHNPGAAEVLARELAGWADRPVLLVFGMLRGKDAAGFIGRLAAAVETCVTVPIHGQTGALTAVEAASVATGVGIRSRAADGIEQALTMLATGCTGTARVLICGSLYLAGEVLALDGTGTPEERSLSGLPAV